MRHPQLLVYETDGRIAGLVREVLHERKPKADDKKPKTETQPSRTEQWSLREPRNLGGCLKLLRGGGPSILVIRLSSRGEQELHLLERVSWLAPETASIVISDWENEMLAGVAWELGACCVLFPTQVQEMLPGILTHLMETAFEPRLSAVGTKGEEAVGPQAGE